MKQDQDMMHLLSDVLVFRLLVSQGFCYEWPQMEWLKTKEVQSLTVLEAQSLKSRHQQGHAPSEMSMKKSFCASSQLLVVGANLPFPGLQLHHQISASSSHPSFLLRALVTDPGPTLVQYGFTFSLHLHRLCLNKITFIGIRDKEFNKIFFFKGIHFPMQTMNHNNKNNKYGFIFMKNLIYYFHTPCALFRLFFQISTLSGTWAGGHST